MKLVQFGAGNIGRGFLGELFHRAGYEIVFIEKNKTLVKEINKKRKYILEIVGPREFKKYEIDGITAIDSAQVSRVRDEIRDADIIAISVGRGAIPFIIPVLSGGLELRNKSNARPINIIIAENILRGGEFLHRLISEEIDIIAREYLDRNVGLVQAVVSRMVPVIPQEIREKDPLYIKAEEYRELPVDKAAFKGDIPVIEGLKPYDNFEAYEERKLFIHNAGHAIVAYLGFIKGYKYIYEAMEDRWIKEKLRDALREIGGALIEKYPFFNKDLWSHIEDLCQRFSNRALADTVKRVGRDPLRKLRPEDRLVGASRFVERYGRDMGPVSIGISACLLYNERGDESSVDLQKMIASKGIGGVLIEVCKIKRDEELYRLVEAGYKDLKEIMYESSST